MGSTSSAHPVLAFALFGGIACAPPGVPTSILAKVAEYPRSKSTKSGIRKAIKDANRECVEHISDTVAQWYFDRGVPPLKNDTNAYRFYFLGEPVDELVDGYFEFSYVFVGSKRYAVLELNYWSPEPLSAEDRQHIFNKYGISTLLSSILGDERCKSAGI